MPSVPVALGLVPLAFALEPGGDPLRSIGAAVFGELRTEILVTLYLTPVLYTLIRAQDKRVEAPEGDASAPGHTAPPRSAWPSQLVSAR